MITKKNCLKLSEMLGGIRSKEIDSEHLLNDHIDAIKKSDLNALIYFEESEARALHTKTKSSYNREDKLYCIPAIVKDNFCTKGTKTTAGSKMLENFIPNYESTVTDKLWQSGSFLLGKSSLDEFAMGSANINSRFGKTNNPWLMPGGTAVVPGGSSGGSAAAVASYLCPFALGTDTGGSVRQPASFCGIVGVKPTYGICSRAGIIPLASSLDQAGVLARNVDDAEYILNIISGFDPLDLRSIKPKNSDTKPSSSLGELRVGVIKDYQKFGVIGELVDKIEDISKSIEGQCKKITEVSIPSIDKALPAYFVVCSTENSSLMSRYDGIKFNVDMQDKGNYKAVRSSCLGDEVKTRIMLGNYFLSEKDRHHCKKAYSIRNNLCLEFNQVFKEVDIIISPTSPRDAFTCPTKLTTVEMYNNDIFTVMVNLCGLPAISIPIGLSKNNLPIGIQIIAKQFDEKTMFLIAKYIEELAQFEQYRKDALLRFF